jgi:tRNA-splicing ligase RtcB
MEQRKMSNYEIMKNGVGLKIYASIVEDDARKQIDLVVNHPAIKDLVAIMPDVHAGAGSVIGLTCRFKESVIPNIVGDDLGCGVVTHKLKCKKIDFAKLDSYIRKNIPTGFSSRYIGWINTQSFYDVSNNMPMDIRQDIDRVIREASGWLEANSLLGNTTPSQQIGTLGGGNHFIEVEKGCDDEFYITIHSGSRKFGLKVAGYYQRMAKHITRQMNLKVPQDMEYLPLGYGGISYLLTARLAQQYAHYNRLSMLYIILNFLGEEYDEDNVIESVHNYISDRDNIVRKGAISAHKDERVVIPLNMGAGVVIGKGKGNKDYNSSAPHGAGRLYGRKDMLRRLDSGTFYSMEAFKESMKGVFTTSVDRSTFDESPFAYKPWDSISGYLEETVDIEQIVRPVYNLKASERKGDVEIYNIG